MQQPAELRSSSPLDLRPDPQQPSASPFDASANQEVPDSPFGAAGEQGAGVSGQHRVSSVSGLHSCCAHAVVHACGAASCAVPAHADALALLNSCVNAIS